MPCRICRGDLRHGIITRTLRSFSLSPLDRRLEYRHLQCLGEDLLQKEGAGRPERVHEAIPPAAARLAPARGGEDATGHTGHPQRPGRVREGSRGYRGGGTFPRLGRVKINSQTQATASVGAHARAVQGGAHERYLSTDCADGGRCVFIGTGGRWSSSKLTSITHNEYIFERETIRATSSTPPINQQRLSRITFSLSASPPLLHSLLFARRDIAACENAPSTCMRHTWWYGINRVNVCFRN